MVKLSLNKLVANNGQIPEVPKNPRDIKPQRYELLRQSLIDDPEFTNLHPLLGIEHGDKVVIIGGNQRLRVMKDLGWSEAEVAIMEPDTPPEVVRARAIKHNADFGSDDFEILANEWDEPDVLESWGLEIPNFDEREPKESNTYTLSIKSDDLDELQDIEVRINDIISEYPNIKVNLK